MTPEPEQVVMHIHNCPTCAAAHDMLALLREIASWNVPNPARTSVSARALIARIDGAEGS